jgi:two-component system nitrogen regulation sensor histidine kinase NtrY
MKNYLTLPTKIILIAVLSSLVGFLCGLLIWLATDGQIFWGLLACVIASLSLAWKGTRHLSHNLQALEIGLLNFKDNDFSVSLSLQGEGEFNALAQLYNDAAAKLRNERQYIYQRELLLDKVIQNSPNVMLLLDSEQRIMYANMAARQLLHQGLQIEGMTLVELANTGLEQGAHHNHNQKQAEQLRDLSPLAQELSPALGQILLGDKEGLFSFGEGELETWHISRGQFTLNNQQHKLILLKQLTRELNRQEVTVWKKVIRIISHELNNSLAPIASMVNSGRILTKDIDKPQLKLIFDTIEDRTSHLGEFISHYAQFAKLPLPQRQVIDWVSVTAQLSQHYPFRLSSALPSMPVLLDRTQLEQVLINLLKNAHESGSKAEDVSLSITEVVKPIMGVLINVEDNGSGMSNDVLEQALLPFYSTKQSGTGLGLPLCREIVEAHGGRISLHNRPQGGLNVSLWLPNEGA